MAERKYQNKPEGNHDNQNHEGWASYQRNLQRAEAELEHFLNTASLHDIIYVASELGDWDSQIDDLGLK